MRRHLADAEKPLRRYAARVLAATAVVAVCAAPLTPIHAADSPSVRAAARLKNHPPRGWIRHYLGADRYKIAGGTWRFVSTELDRFYYPAYAPEMLRQSPGRVIGFASAKDAEEAGYLPGAGYANVDPGFDRAYAGAGGASTRGDAQRITLADGASSVLLPASWRRVMTQNQQGRALDVLQGPGKNLMFVMKLPVQTSRGYSVENIMSPRIWRTILDRAASSGGRSAGVASEMRNTRVTKTQIGGMRGIALNFPRGSGGPMGLGNGGRAYMVGTGNTLFFVQASGDGGSKLLDSLRLR